MLSNQLNKNIMKKPSLEEVKEYFKDAEKVICIHDNDIYYLDFSQELREQIGSIILENQEDEPYSGRNTFVNLWHKERGYAKILTYKEPKEETFVIDKGFLKAICQEIELNQQSAINWIKEKYPSAFFEDKKELVLESGKWYNIQTKTTKYLLLYSDNKNELYAGFMDGNWGNDWLCRKDCNQKLAVLATPEEVKEALTKEAVKRYKDGDVIGCLKGIEHEWSSKEVFRKVKHSTTYYYQTNGDFWIHDEEGKMMCAFFEGVWASKAITKAEAEQKLNYKII